MKAPAFDWAKDPSGTWHVVTHTHAGDATGLCRYKFKISQTSSDAPGIEHQCEGCRWKIEELDAA